MASCRRCHPEILVSEHSSLSIGFGAPTPLSRRRSLAVIFVIILEWDQPEEWPPLFGSITDAYSLSLFWGAFWHRCHVNVFEAYMPSPDAFPFRRNPKLRFGLQLDRKFKNARWVKHVVKNAARALWRFSMSAVCHCAMHWVSTGRTNACVEFRFFLLNWGVCLTETVGARVIDSNVLLHRTSHIQRCVIRTLGYVWVLWVFFSLVPSWQYPLVLVRTAG
ncbi:hypothetical protein GE09DRAFT_33210 [Coniochaeta sp. 2T2.1]|nr:hypothetical protein GE09DRAFT_33210 [Coniochaeta sp. 2T2.1]